MENEYKNQSYLDTDYYNKKQYDKIEQISKVNPEKAICLFEAYLEDYPYDYQAWYSYIITLTIFRQTEKALKILQDVEFRLENDYELNVCPEKLDRIKALGFLSKMKLLCFSDNYSEAYKELILHSDLAIELSFEKTDLFLRKKLGKLSTFKEKSPSYIYNQIRNYSEADMRLFVKKHSSKYNENAQSKNMFIFSPDFDIDGAIDEVKKYIPSNKGMFYGMTDDIYFFKYDFCGTDDGNWTDFFRATCVHGTSDITDVAPVYGFEKLPYVDLNYLRKTDDVKVKQISRIDKFYKKYNMDRK